ncbi:MAG: pyridoxamine 5'-phosphate oxidase family protein [Gammaproteobacteria bacterium]|nr:pyridoxamine 5'-phosphate oxidase family protein [Gammaproteobacteria bacterium]
MTSSKQAPSSRATLKRNAVRAQYDKDVLREVLASQQICTVAYVHQGEPRQIATLYFCDDTHMYLHGNRQSALLRHMSQGGEVCINVMLVDGIVVARSGFHCSMNYRSVTLFGKGEGVTGPAHRKALDDFVAVLIPGHEKVVREPTSQELAATAVARIPLDEMSAKIRAGDPVDDEGDLDSEVWAGEIPLRKTALTPIASENLRADIILPQYIEHLQVKG